MPPPGTKVDFQGLGPHKSNGRDPTVSELPSQHTVRFDTRDGALRNTHISSRIALFAMYGLRHRFRLLPTASDNAISEETRNKRTEQECLWPHP